MQLFLWSLGLLTCMALTGIQPAIATPSVSANVTSAASSLPLDGEGDATTHIVKVSTLLLSTDSSKGFTVTISSGSLTKTGQETPIAYQVKTVASGSNPPSSADFTIASGNNYTFSTNQTGSQNCDLYVLYSPANLQDPGTYGTNVSIFISDNP